MHNSYISCSTMSVRCKKSQSFSFNDYPCCFLNDRCYRNNPISLPPSYCCCACCANSSLYRVPKNPIFLYGLRQSTLIQWSSGRRLILAGVNQCYSRFPVCDINRDSSYGKSYTFKERGVIGRRGKWGKGRFGCNVNDAEVLLSLLTEEVSEECFRDRERNGSREKNVRRVQVDKVENKSGDSSYKSKKKDVGSLALESTLMHEFESVELKFREEDRRRKEDRREEKREKFSRGETRGARSEASSCSSYYSCSSSGEFGSDSKIQAKRDGFTGESSSVYQRDRGESRYDGEFLEDVDRHRSYAEKQEVVLKKENIEKELCVASSGFDYDWRKKSEKKLDEELIEQNESWKEPSEKHVRLSGVQESGFGKSSYSHKQYDGKKETSSLAINIDEATRQQYGQAGQRDIGQSESRIKYKKFTEMPEIHDSAFETASSSQKQYRGRVENLLGSSSSVLETTGEQLKTDGLVTREEKHRRNSQQLAKSLKIQEIDNRETFKSHRLSEIRMKNLEDDATMVPGLVDDKLEQHYQAGQPATRQMGSGGEFQQLTGVSNNQDINIQNTFISQKKSDYTMIAPEEISNSAVISNPETPSQLSRMDSEAIRRMESGEEFLGISSNNVAGVATTTSSNMVTEKRTSTQQGYSSSSVNLVEKTRERYNSSDERVLHIGSQREAQRPTKVRSFHGGMSDEATSSHSSLKLGSQSTAHQVVAIEDNNTSSNATVTAQLYVEPTSGIMSHDFRSESLASGSSALYVPTFESSPALQDEIYGGARSEFSDEDAIGSAARLQKSSMHFVGEFVEKVRHEVSTSEFQDRRTYETKLVHGGEPDEQKGLGQYSSCDSEQKDHDSRRLSQGSRTKGPSDEMWDVTVPSIQEPVKTEVPEATNTTGNGVGKRSGRSLWSVISDVVRLRWGSCSETNNSRSGGKSSPNQSTSSEAWFSGHEPDESNVENINQGRIIASHESSSVDQKQPGRIHAQSPEEVSISMRSNDKVKHADLGLPAPSIIQSSSAPVGILSPTVEETDAKHSEGTSSGTATEKSVLPLPAIRMRRSPPVVLDISEAGKTDASGSGTMAPIEHTVSTKLTEVSGTEGKIGELKQRKLQRNNQVLKDRFDEWEEAYIFETEQQKNDEMFMREALLEAKKAADIWEVPVGAVLVQHGKIIARGYNLVEELRDSTAHAEMICIREASNILRSWRLSETTLYVTLEPCPMCAGAILQARIDTIVWGAPNKLLGADGSWIRLFPNGGEGQNGSELTDKPAAPVHPFHPNVKIRRGILASECADVMQQFFQLRRRKKDKKPDPPTPPTPPSCLPISNRPSKFLTKMHDAFNTMFCL